MHILLLGKNGQLGWELHRSLATLGKLSAWDYPDIDFCQPTNLAESVKALKPDIIVNAAAYTNVDGAERDTETAELVNAKAVGELAQVAFAMGSPLIHISTDYIFDGLKKTPYQENDTPNPINAYGESKYHGEQAIGQVGCQTIIFRTSWMYSPRRNNYVKKVLHWARTHPTLRVVTDQIGCPTSARMLAQAIAQLLAQAGEDLQMYFSRFGGIYHLAGDGYTSRYDFAREILRFDPYPEEHVYQQMLQASTSDFPTPAIRPLNSALDCSKFNRTFGFTLPPWKMALELVMGELCHLPSSNPNLSTYE